MTPTSNVKIKQVALTKKEFKLRVTSPLILYSFSIKGPLWSNRGIRTGIERFIAEMTK